ncbi:alcohol dehydrogenase [Apodospora peruviana]|uniref:Alcohol dehydrogenase n=1 Tax=Apodospora peruviana TaxID=516989 RepID=A0AAE0MA66_9PEZI|nr:alcohol dehydrogenase [Apodospora peruviana]
MRISQATLSLPLTLQRGINIKTSKMAAIPETHRAYRRTPGTGTAENPVSIEQTTEPTIPSGGKLGPHDVMIRIRAVSLNYRDIAMLNGRYTMNTLDSGIVASDCAAEVAALGSSVTDFKVGDRVSPIFALEYRTGNEDLEVDEFSMLGGDCDGVLREYAVFEDKVLVHLPKHLTWEEASTIACAGCTAWNALNAPSSLGQNKTALLQGTGGVSMFALLIALAGDIKPIISSSSDQKLEAIKKLAPEGTILGYNYKANPDQSAAVRAMLGGKGVDIIVNNTGPPNIPADIATLRRNGRISLVGFLEGVLADWNPAQLMALIGKSGSITGIAFGAKTHFEALNRFIEEKNVRLEPLVDRVFGFDEAKAAFEHLNSGKHVGKVVIKF